MGNFTGVADDVPLIDHIDFKSSAKFYALTTPITTGVTVSNAPAGSLAITTNATGIGHIYYSNGSLWELIA